MKNMAAKTQSWLRSMPASWDPGPSSAASVAEVAPAVAASDASPNEEVTLVAPAEGEEAKVAPEGGKEKPPAADEAAASPDVVGCAAGGVGDGSPPLPAQQQLR